MFHPSPVSIIFHLVTSAYSAIQNLIIIIIFKLMVLRDRIWQLLVHLLILQWCVLFLCLAKLYIGAVLFMIKVHCRSTTHGAINIHIYLDIKETKTWLKCLMSFLVIICTKLLLFTAHVLVFSGYNFRLMEHHSRLFIVWPSFIW